MSPLSALGERERERGLQASERKGKTFVTERQRDRGREKAVTYGTPEEHRRRRFHRDK